MKTLRMEFWKIPKIKNTLKTPQNKNFQTTEKSYKDIGSEKLRKHIIVEIEEKKV